jgi:carbon-monoxide dehydrogenase small subunit
MIGSTTPEATVSVSFDVNDGAWTGQVEARTTLADLLRDDIGLTGTKVSCEVGVCGACTILLDGLPVRACLHLAVQADGRRITTVEGLAADGELSPVQKAFQANHALQCGFCTPGFLVLTTWFLQSSEGRELSERSIRELLASNICRCTGYHNMVNAVRQLSEGDGGPL